MRLSIMSLIAVALCSFAIVGPAQSAELNGTWSGGGYIKPRDGARERVRCRIRYTKETAKVYRVSASCATTAQKITQTGSLLKVGSNRYVGNFHNPQYDISGRVRVVVSGSRQSVSLSSGRGHGSLSLRKR